MRPRLARVCVATGLSGYETAVPWFILALHASVYVPAMSIASLVSGPPLKSPTKIRGPEKLVAQLLISSTSTTRFDDAASSRCVAKKFMFCPPTLIVAWATDRCALRNLELTDVKAYFDRIRLPSSVPSYFGANCVYHVRPVFWESKLTSVGTLPDGTSQSPTMSGLLVA